MNLEQAFHQRWSQVTALESLLPAARVTTGQARDTAFPCATLEVGPIRSALPTNEGPAIRVAEVRVNVRHEGYSAAKAIVEALRDGFDGATLELPGSAHSARLRHVADSNRQQDDGAWHWTVEFEAKTHLV
jgi:hypothetical protein